jgi:hypothetical protein
MTDQRCELPRRIERDHQLFLAPLRASISASRSPRLMIIKDRSLVALRLLNRALRHQLREPIEAGGQN